MPHPRRIPRVVSPVGLLLTCLSLVGSTAAAASIAAVVFLSPGAAWAQDVYYLRSISGVPWGRLDNEAAMNAVFGIGNWVDARFETVDTGPLFAAEFIFMEGSDFTANELENFLTANASAIDSFVRGGGVIFVNSAPNEGDGMSLGFGASLQRNVFCRSGCTAVDPAHPIFNGPHLPVGTSWTGNAFSHAIIHGPITPLIRDSSGNTILGELEVGSGLVVLGGMTMPSFHSPQPQAQNLRQNIIAYARNAAPQCFVIDAIDDQFDVINDGKTASLAILNNDECKADAPVSVVTRPGDLQPDRGGAAITDGTEVLYIPASGFVGFEEFRYTAQDAGLEGGEDPPSVDQDTARVVVNVSEDIAPVAVDDVATTSQSQSVIIDVLANDALGNGPTHSLTIETPPANGSVTLQPDDTIRYSPNFNFFGEDPFEYRLTDANGDSDVATVTVGVFFVQGAVAIDIMPHDAGNNINLRSGQGSGFEVAILSVGEFFDAPNVVDPLTLKLGPRQANIWSTPRVRDVDGDGDDDLVVKFLMQQTGIACGDSHASLSGRTFEFRSISGSDVINTFNCPRVRKRH